jgi:hypothetical protein
VAHPLLDRPERSTGCGHPSPKGMAQVMEAEYQVRSIVDRAIAILAAGGSETQAAARQHTEISGERDIASIEQGIVRETTFMQRRLSA